MARKQIQKIRKVWYDYNVHLASEATDYDPQMVNNQLASFFCPGPFYFYVFDFASFQFIEMSESYRGIIGLNPEALTMNQFLSRIHPDDVDFFSRCEARLGKFLFEEITPQQILNYKVSYCFRLLTADESYKLFLHQATGITLDEENKLGKVLGVHSDISHITTVNKRKLSFFGLNGEKSFVNIDVYDEEKNVGPFEHQPFTPREMEVIRLLSEGTSNREIAAGLSISTGTVRKHRENILKKAGVKNTSQLIAWVIRDGLI